MSDYPALLRVLVGGNDLNAEQMAFAIGAMMDGDWTPVQAGGFLAALATKGETPGELVGAAEALEDPPPHRGRDARARVGDGDLPLLTHPPLGERHRAGGRRDQRLPGDLSPGLQPW